MHTVIIILNGPIIVYCCCQIQYDCKCHYTMQVLLQTVLLNINKEESGNYKQVTPLLLSLYLFTGIKIT